jgi:uncharacterized protein DUF6230
MDESLNPPVEGRTRWRRFLILFTPALALMLAVLVLTASGVLATPIIISGTQFQVGASNLSVPVSAQGSSAYIQYGDVDLLPNGAVRPVTVTVLKAATLTDMTQVICAPTGLGGSAANLKVTISANPASASNLMVDATALSGDATFTDLKIGVPVTSREGTTTFGQTATNVTINNLSQTALYTSAGTFTLSGLRLSVSFASSC